MLSSKGFPKVCALALLLGPAFGTLVYLYLQLLLVFYLVYIRGSIQVLNGDNSFHLALLSTCPLL